MENDLQEPSKDSSHIDFYKKIQNLNEDSASSVGGEIIYNNANKQNQVAQIIDDQLMDQLTDLDIDQNIYGQYEELDNLQ